MGNDTKAIIGIIVVAAISLGGLLSVQFSVQIAGVNTRIDDVNTRIDDLRTGLIDRIDTVKTALSNEIATVKADLSAEIADIRTDLRRLDDRLRAVEIAFGKVDQRLETLERLHLPAPEPGASGS